MSLSVTDSLTISRRFAGLSEAGRAALKERLRARRIDLTGLPLVPIRGESPGPFPLSLEQERLWFLCRLAPEAAGYIMAGTLRLGGALAPSRLKAAITRVVAAHDSLRTRFLDVDGEGRQTVAPEPVFGWEERAVAENALAAEVARAVTAPFDLERGALLRAALFWLGEEDHVLVLAMHHIVSDGWSIDILLRDLARAYAGEDLPVRDLSYVDYALWQRAMQDEEEQIRQLDYWRAALGGEAEPLRLPADRARGAVRGSEGRREAAAVPEGLAVRLRGLARAEGTTLSTLLLAAWQALLHRYGGQREIRVGVPYAGRERAEVQDLIGFFLNTLVLRAEIGPATDFRGLLAQQTARMAEARAHAAVPFARVVEVLGLARSLSETPVFQTIFNLQSAPEARRLALGDLVVSDYAGAPVAAQYDLALDVFDRGGALRLALTYANDIFDPETGRCILDAYLALLAGLARDPDQRIGALPLPGTEPGRQALARPYRPLTERLAEAAAARPDAPAITCGAERVDHATLDHWSDVVALRLQAAGLTPEEPVGLCVARSSGTVAALIGILKAGGAYLPLDPDFPAERLIAMIADAGLRRVVADAETAARLAPVLGGCTVISGDMGEGRPAPHRPLPGALAYVIYTSGSTGTPKGVGISHGALSLHLDDFTEAFDYGPADVALQFSTINFDAAAEQMLPLLAVGGHVVLRGPEAWTPADLTRAVLEHGLTIADVPTSFWQEWSRDLPPGTRLRRVTVGGEALAGDHLALWRRGPLGHVRLDNRYGPTETTMSALYHRTRACDEQAVIVPIGRAYPGRSARVADAAGDAVPMGGAGELCIGGESLARGYLGRPGLTAGHFVPDAEGLPGSRLYRTGDLCRVEADGTVAFLGRADGQVKLRGFRIELGEIEAALRALPGVREAAVVLRGAGDTARLVAYVVGEAEEDGLAAGLGARLPAHMLPSAVMRLPALPMTPTGKLDRRALPEPPAAAIAGRAAETAAEATLCRIVAALLGLAAASPDDDFFRLGGDSILSLRLVAMARAEGLALTPRLIFEHSRLDRLAAVATPVTAAGMASAGTTGPIPLTPIQAEFFRRHPAGRNRWNQSVLLRLTGAVDPAALARAIAALVDRHEALRLRFRRSPEGVWSAEPGPAEGAFIVETIDLAATPERLEEAGVLIQAGLDMIRGPLLRAALIHLGEGDDRLLIVIHHLVVDGVSWRILLDDLAAAYAGQRLGPAPGWGAWARGLAAYGAGLATAEADIWQSALAGAQPWPPEPRAVRAEALRRVSRLDAERTAQLLRETSHAFRTTPEDLLLAALARAVSRIAELPGALVMLEGHGREDIVPGLDLSAMVGWFTTQYPVWLPAEGDAGATLIAVKDRLRALPRRGLHYGLLPAAGRDALPAPRIGFNYLGEFDATPRTAAALPVALSTEPHGPALDPAAPLDHALDVTGGVTGGQLVLTWTASPDALAAETLDSLVVAFEAELVRLIDLCRATPPGATAGDFPLARLGVADLARLRPGLAGIEDIYPATPVQQGMLAHALRNPGAGFYAGQLHLELRPDLDPAAFRASFAAVIARHAALRTGFDLGAGQGALQVVHADASLPCVVLDWSGMGEGYGAILARFLEEDRTRPFDIAAPPLMRVTLICRPDLGYDLIWTSHHALLDGWSQSRLMGEIAMGYEAIRAGKTAALPPVRPYRDYVAWLATQDAAASEARWRAMFAGVEPALLCPAIDRPEPPAEGQGEREMALGRTLSDRLRLAARAHGLTLGTLLQGAWAMLLARRGGNRHAAFGITVAGRPAALEGVEGMLGLFIDSLPLWLEVPAEAPLWPWLDGLQCLTADLRQHEQTPLPSLLRLSGRSAEALFDNLLVFENYPVDAAARGITGHLAPRNARQRERTHYPLTLMVQDGEDGLVLRWLWDRARIADAAARTLSRDLGDILAWIAGAEVPRLAELELQGPAARPAIRHPFRSVLDRIAAQPGEAVVIRHGGESWSYARLRARAAGVSARLGPAPEERIGLCAARSPALVAGMLGILGAGAAYVPLDPAYPAARRTAIMQDAGIRRVVADAEGVAALGPSIEGCEIIALEDAAEAAGWAALPPQPEQLAYVIYTSGSTGLPKGVGISHAALARLLDSTAAYGFSARDIWTLFHSYAFDFSVWEIFGALCHGGKLVIVPGETARDPQAFHALLRAEAVTILNQTPSAFAPLAEVDRRAAAPLSSLRLLIFGGEKLEPDLLESWRAARGAALPRIVNMYGITETTVHVTHRDMTGDERESLIGPALDDLSLCLIGADGLPVPGPGIGEIAVGGAGLARGYLGRPGLTAERFVPDSAGPPGSRLYRSGDLGRRREDDEIVYLGRADAQVKLRGFRIEPGEIEAALRAEAGVAQAVVIVKQGRLAAYVTGAAEPAALAVALAARLPAHMLPATIQPLERLPLTVNGKLDQSALPMPDFAAEVFLPPEGEAESAVAEAAAFVLDLPRISIGADFFRAGGDSISAMRLAARLSERLGREVPLAVLFDQPVLRDFAATLAVAADRSSIPRRPVVGTESFPLSFEQERLWFLWRLAPDSSAYTMAAALSLTGLVDAARLGAALTAVVARHESLRTRFLEIDGEGRQVVDAEPRFGWVDAQVTEAELAEAADRIVSESFDLTRSPLIRAGLFRRGPDEAVLVFAMHHIVSDGWSVDLLLRDLTAAYEGRSLAPPPIQYADYALWQRRVEDNFATQLAYWRGMLSGEAEPLRLPTDRPRGAVRGTAGGRVTAVVPEALAARLRRIAAGEGTTLSTLLLAAWQALLSRYAGQERIRIGIPFAGRARAELQEVIGFFLNTLVLQADVAPGMTFRDLLRQQGARMAEAHANAEVPFARLVESLGIPRSLSETPLFQTMFNLEQAAVLPAPDGLTARPYLLGAATARYDLALNLVEADEGLHAALTFAADIFDQATAERILAAWQRLLAGIANAPDARIGALPLETPPSVPPPAAYRFVPAHRRISETAMRCGGSLALTCGDQRLSHAALDAWSSAIAAELSAIGVGAESLVGLAVSRGPGLVAAMLGIFKAGGAFLPLDTDHPADRLRHMVADAAPLCILADAATEARLRALAGETPIRLLPAQDSRASFAPPPIQPDQFAYVLYTSGSTGLPKGVAVSHRSLSLHLDDFIASHGITERDVVLNSSTIGFDVALHEILPALVQGGRVVMRGTAPWTLESLTETLTGEGVTFARIPTALWQQWLRAGVPALPALRQVTVGGEALPGDALPRWFASPLKEVALDNLYGPTETTVAALRHSVMRTDAASVIVPIGRPYPGRTAMVLDAGGDAVPPGGHGELCIGGESVARGYLGKPALTAERFVPDPAGAPGSRLYRSGDLCRPLADGGIAFLGRLDRQVKLRGFRIELGEIEAALRALPDVREAVVELRGRGESARLVGYLVGDADIDHLRASLGQRLPAHMVPAAFVRLAALPISPTGKLDRAALPEPAETGSRGRAPATSAEETLCRTVAALLGRESVSPEDNFFALGGDSLMSLRLLAACRAAGLGRVTLAGIFAAADLAALAREDALPEGVQRLNGAGRPALFCLHPSYGSTAEYAPLARTLEQRMTLYGLDSPALDETPWHGESFAELAAVHVARLRAVQAQGPYRLLGWSLGGWLAVEVAHQLEAAGEDIVFLGIVDTLAVATPDSVTETGPAEPDDAAVLAHLRTAGAGHLIPERLAQGDMTALRRAVGAFHLHNRLLRGFRLPEIRAPLTVWWSAETARRYPDLQDWTRIAARVDDRGVVAGTTHLTILQEGRAVAAIASEASGE